MAHFKIVEAKQVAPCSCSAGVLPSVPPMDPTHIGVIAEFPYIFIDKGSLGTIVDLCGSFQKHGVQPSSFLFLQRWGLGFRSCHRPFPYEVIAIFPYIFIDNRSLGTIMNLYQTHGGQPSRAMFLQHCGPGFSSHHKHYLHGVIAVYP